MKHNKRKRSKLISFDTETITKQVAEVLVKEKRESETTHEAIEQVEIPKVTKSEKKKRKKEAEAQENEEVEATFPKKKNNKRKNSAQLSSDTKTDETNASLTGETNEESPSAQTKATVPKRKKNKREQQKNSLQVNGNTKTNEAEASLTEETNEESPSAKTKVAPTGKPAEESIRSKKRKKHQQLLQAKKLKHELAMQQKCLNYLSLWKHDKETWKFEKLKQVWLQQNMYNSAKIPDEFWNILIEYFENSKGKARNTIIQDAIKIVEQAEEEDCETNETEKEDLQIKVHRARDIVQNLQEQ